jgi:broad specificity phosphatase PhoE
MTQVLLIRHGDNDLLAKGKLYGRKPGVHLNERGLAQAKKLAEALKNEKLSAVYSSPLDRALETAKPIAKSHKLEVTGRWGLEESDIGKWQDKSFKRLTRTKAWQDLQLRPSRFRFPGGESIQEQQARLIAEIEEILAMHKPKDTIACVSHADPIKLIVAFYLGLPLDLFQRLQIATASLSRLHFSESGFMLGSLNERLGEASE